MIESFQSEHDKLDDIYMEESKIHPNDTLASEDGIPKLFSDIETSVERNRMLQLQAPDISPPHSTRSRRKRANRNRTNSTKLSER